MSEYPAIPQPTDVNTALVLRKLREVLEILLRRTSGQGGAPVTRSVVTIQDLLDLGLIQDADTKRLRSTR